MGALKKKKKRQSPRETRGFVRLGCGVVVLTCSCRAAARCAGSAAGSWPGRLGTHR